MVVNLASSDVDVLSQFWVETLQLARDAQTEHDKKELKKRMDKQRAELKRTQQRRPTHAKFPGLVDFCKSLQTLTNAEWTIDAARIY